MAYLIYKIRKYKNYRLQHVLLTYPIIPITFHYIGLELYNTIISSM